MNNGIIRINELRLENDQYVSKPCLVNTNKIISVQSGELSKTGAHILGDERRRVLQMILLEGNNRVFVEDGIDDILQKMG